MRILVTGASGFMGKNLIVALAKNHEVIVLSRTKPQINARFTHIACDFSQKHDFEAKLEGNFDAVYHLAQSENFRKLPDFANDLFQVNIASTQYLLDFSRKRGVKWFYYASSGSVYEPYNTSMEENRPITSNGYYALSKYTAERLVQSYQNAFKTCIFRLFFPYGEGQKDRLFSMILERVKTNTPIDIQGGKGLLFTPTHIEDVIKYSILAMEDELSGLYNVSAPHILSVKEMAEIIAEKLNKKVIFNFKKQEIAPSILPNLLLFQSKYPNAKFLTFKQGISFL